MKAQTGVCLTLCECVCARCHLYTGSGVNRYVQNPLICPHGDSNRTSNSGLLGASAEEPIESNPAGTLLSVMKTLCHIWISAIKWSDPNPVLRRRTEHLQGTNTAGVWLMENGETFFLGQSEIVKDEKKTGRDGKVKWLQTSDSEPRCVPSRPDRPDPLNACPL